MAQRAKSGGTIRARRCKSATRDRYRNYSVPSTAVPPRPPTSVFFALIYRTRHVAQGKQANDENPTIGDLRYSKGGVIKRREKARSCTSGITLRACVCRAAAYAAVQTHATAVVRTPAARPTLPCAADDVVGIYLRVNFLPFSKSQRVSC